MRRVHATSARAALGRACRAARLADVPALIAEAELASHVLDRPAARLIARGADRAILLDEVETLMASDALIVDACRHVVRQGAAATVALTTRPVLFVLVRALAEAWPGDVPRDALITRAFRARLADDSHRARLRVEIGRLRAALRAALRPMASISATKHGFTLVPHDGCDVIVLARPVEEPHSAMLAFLSDGESWSSSALALALGASQRTVQRALDTLAAADKVQWTGRGRSRRWMTPPVPGFTTALLLPASLSDD